jgi:hypothetical protein
MCSAKIRSIRAVRRGGIAAQAREDSTSSNGAASATGGVRKCTEPSGRKLRDSRCPTGDYIVVAMMDGYVVPISTPVGKDDADDTEVSLDDRLPRSPVAHVAAKQTTQVDVTMARGGVISGRVLFDDRTPVVQASIQVQLAKWKNLNEGPVLSQQLSKLVGGQYKGTTDDQGRYRIAGLEPGKYRVLTTINFEVKSRVTSIGVSQFREGGPASGIASELVPSERKST